MGRDKHEQRRREQSNAPVSETNETATAEQIVETATAAVEQIAEQATQALEQVSEQPAPPAPQAPQAPPSAPAKPEPMKVAGLTREQFLATTNGNKSAAIRKLASEHGMKTGPISRFLEIKYQFARQVLLVPVGSKVPAPTVAPAPAQNESEAA